MRHYFAVVLLALAGGVALGIAWPAPNSDYPTPPTLPEAERGTLRFVTWNIRDLGRSKSPGEIDTMAQLLRGADLVAIQEVVAKDPAGARAVARLADALDRTGADWDYAVSDPTDSSTPHRRERYAFLWRTSAVRRVGRPRLLAAFAKTVEREPYLGVFAWTGGEVAVATFHARPHDEQPEREIAALRPLLAQYATGTPLLLAGDLNVVSHHTVFGPWRRAGYAVVPKGLPTTLRRTPARDGSRYVHESDYVLVPTDRLRVVGVERLDLVAYAGGDLAAANRVSDHAPVLIGLRAARP